jgi:Lactonase, 7-bladed beta-propeller
MLKRISGVVALVGLCALSVFFVSCGSSSSRPSGLLYVLSQEASSVSSYAVDLGSGNLSLINSKANTCADGSSCGLPLQISLDSAGASALVLNQGVPGAITTVDSANCPQADTIPCGVVPTLYPYTVNSDGSFSKPATPGTWTDEQDNDTAVAMVRDPATNFLFVINQGTSPAPANCPHQPTPISTQNPQGDPNDACPSISVFNTQSGSLTLTGNNCAERGNQPCPYRLKRIPTSLSVITYTPTSGSAQTVLFMTSNQDLTTNHNDNELSVLAVDSAGNIAESSSSPYTTQINPTVVRVVNTSGAGQNASSIFAYVGTSGVSAGGVTPFQLCAQQDSDCSADDVANHRLLPAGATTSVGQTPVAMLVDPTNSFMYVACRGSNQVFAFSMGSSSGKLTALNPANQPTGALPVALAMHGGIKSTTEYLYAANNGSNSITGWSVVSTSGSLGNPITVTFAAGQPSGMAGR